jgi:hypothetical protein
MQTDGSTLRHSTKRGNVSLHDAKFFRMHTYEKRACKSFGMHSYKIVELKVPWNEHLQKNGGRGPSLPPCLLASVAANGVRKEGEPMLSGVELKRVTMPAERAWIGPEYHATPAITM